MGCLLSVHQQVAGSNPVWSTTWKLYRYNGCRASLSFRQFSRKSISGDSCMAKCLAKTAEVRLMSFAYLNRFQR